MRSTGLGQRLYVGGVNLSGDVGSIDNCSSPLAVIDVTRLGKSAYERLAGARDGTLEYTAFFNPGVAETLGDTFTAFFNPGFETWAETWADTYVDTYTASYSPAALTGHQGLSSGHRVLSALPISDVVQTYCTGTAIGDPAAALVAKQINYDGQRGNDGAFTFTVSTQANGYGLDWGRLVTAAPRWDATATNGTSYDFGTGSTAFGLQAYLQVLFFAGSSATIKLQESSDDGGSDAWADVTGGSFGARSAAGAARIASSRTQAVKRYLRVVTTGAFTSCSFVVAVKRNDVATPI